MTKVFPTIVLGMLLIGAVALSLFSWDAILTSYGCQCQTSCECK